MKVINLTPWAGPDFSHQVGDILDLPDATAKARIEAGLCQPVPPSKASGKAPEPPREVSKPEPKKPDPRKEEIEMTQTSQPAPVSVPDKAPIPHPHAEPPAGPKVDVPGDKVEKKD